MKLQDNTWIIAVSGGPDSMALLDKMRKKGLDLIVAHVNYHKRATADRDQEGVTQYCLKHQLKLEVLAPTKTTKENFQAWARDVRYQFFKRLVKKYQAQGVLVAHQLDDVLETYIMQKERNTIPYTYGIAKEAMIFNVLVKRPLLHLTKKQLENYCLRENVAYFIDETNLDNHYKRNQVRHQLIDHLSLAEKRAMKKEIDLLNSQRLRQQKEIDRFLKLNYFNYLTYAKFDLEQRLSILRRWIDTNLSGQKKLSKKQLIDLDHALAAKKNMELPLAQGTIFKSYEICEIMGNTSNEYEYVLQSIYELKTAYFQVEQTGLLINAVTVKESDFPLTIRNYQPNDVIQLRFGHKKINRWFIDRKISLKQRKSWPIVLNCHGEVILVPGIGCNITHFTTKPNLYVVKY